MGLLSSKQKNTGYIYIAINDSDDIHLSYHSKPTVKRVKNDIYQRLGYFPVDQKIYDAKFTDSLVDNFSIEIGSHLYLQVKQYPPIPNIETLEECLDIYSNGSSIKKKDMYGDYGPPRLWNIKHIHNREIVQKYRDLVHS